MTDLQGRILEPFHWLKGVTKVKGALKLGVVAELLDTEAWNQLQGREGITF